VHLFGQCAATEKLAEIAQRYDLALVEDACQAMGARRNGRHAGTLGDIAAFSFYPTKNLGGFGDGGLVTTGSDELAQKVRSFRAHGVYKDSYKHYSLGMNSRLDAIQAAALNTKLPALEDWLKERRQIAARYDELIEHSLITKPTTAPANQHTYHQYTIRISEKRDLVCEALDAQDIGHKIFYPVPLHLQPCFKTMGYQEGDLPRSEQAAKEVVSLPIFPGLTEDEIRQVADVLLKAVENAG
jgi:dTDP-4-amino-4,6-dideoxygalactose transaminase